MKRIKSSTIQKTIQYELHVSRHLNRDTFLWHMFAVKKRAISEDTYMLNLDNTNRKCKTEYSYLFTWCKNMCINVFNQVTPCIQKCLMVTKVYCLIFVQLAFSCMFYLFCHFYFKYRLTAYNYAGYVRVLCSFSEGLSVLLWWLTCDCILWLSSSLISTRISPSSATKTLANHCRWLMSCFTLKISLTLHHTDGTCFSTTYWCHSVESTACYSWLQLYYKAFLLESTLNCDTDCLGIVCSQLSILYCYICFLLCCHNQGNFVHTCTYLTSLWFFL